MPHPVWTIQCRVCEEHQLWVGQTGCRYCGATLLPLKSRDLKEVKEEKCQPQRKT